MRLQLTLFKKEAIFSLVLPEKYNGQYWVTQINEKNEEEKVISVEGIEGKWILKSNKNAIILNKNNEKIKEIPVEPLNFYRIFLKDTNEKVLLYSEPITDDRRIFEKLLLPTDGRITIGRSEKCDISFSNAFTSSNHGEIIISNDITIKDLNSSNGTFVNGIRGNSKVLMPGDIVYIMGLKLIISKGFIAINNPDGSMNYNKEVLRKFPRQSIDASKEEEDFYEDGSRINLFYRSPRFKRDIKKAEIKIDPPPALGNLEETPLMFLLGPSITMGMASLFTGVLTLQNVMRNNGDIMMAMPTLMMSFSMLLGTVMWPILTKKYERKKRTEKELLRKEKYREYIKSVRERIVKESEHQSEILHENHVTVENCISRIKLRQRNLWERTLGHNDFLRVRMGIGNVPLEADIKYPEKRFTIEDDVLQEELYTLAEEPSMLRQVPITLSLTENLVTGIIGNRENIVDLIKGILVQLTALHSYDELKLVFIYDKKEQNLWNFTKWLPHVWNRERSLRFIATSPSEVKELSAFLEKEIAIREKITSEEELKEVTPHYVIFSMNKTLAGKSEIINSILKHKKNYGFSLITAYDELNNLPKECSRVIELSRSISKIYDKNDITGNHIPFKPDICMKDDMEDLAISLSNTLLDTTVQVYELPTMLTFLEMFGVGKVEHLNALTRWKENDPTRTLETPVGVDNSGEAFNLDLHEKFHGPHGLIAGMTGSGKSEFIMTFILSLAVNYHPHEVAFILIDYKGGGMANAFTDLPHLAGTITNLDGAAVKRSLVSIQSELKRRQGIFNQASKNLNISNIDIYKYQKLYREGTVNEPLQHLFIISDEFAELKTQQPEFMEQLVSAARIGRSLGVHLILATQKPSGVVDDQIWSNSRFRICLKVQEKADSMDVIKRPDAAELSVTGRFFVQVGFNEVFELGQSAWAGAPYYPAERVEKNLDDSIAIVDNLGRIIRQVRPDKNKAILRNPAKQIDEVNKYLAKLAKEENINVRPLWLEPIPEFIYIEELEEKYKVDKESTCILNPIIGEFDDPINQRQLIMTVPLTHEGNTVIYGAAGNGKTTFLTTLIYSLMKEHTPEEVNIYVLDFSSETLRAFAKASHVGDVVFSQDSEKISNLFKMLHSEIEKRKKLFADYGGDYQSYIKNSNKILESMVIFIHNYSAFAEIYEDMEESIAYLTREGTKYGIYFVVTALNTGALRYRILQNFKQLFVLQLNDKGDYSGILGNVDGVYPSKYKGRGIFKTDSVYEFQTAHISKKGENTFDFVRRYCNEYGKQWTKLPAKKIPILPSIIDLEYLTNEIKHSINGNIPIGVEKKSLNTAYYDFNNSYINLVLYQNNHKSDFIQGVAEAIDFKDENEVLVIDAEGNFNDDKSRGYQYIHNEFDKVVLDLFNTLVFRNNSYKEAIAKGEETPEFKKVTCIINSLTDLMIKVSEDSKDKIKVFLEKGEVHYNMNFIICNSASNIASVAYENWFKSKVSLSDGIWLGNGISDQYQLKLASISSDLYEDIGEEFGYIITKGKVNLIKLLSSITSNREGGLNG